MNQLRNPTILVILYLCLILALSSIFSTKEKTERKQASSQSSVKAAKQISDVIPFALSSLVASIKTECVDESMPCILKALGTDTETYGPAAGMATLQALQKDGTILPSEDDHQIAHKIGRKTAEVFGTNGSAFIACPTAYNYGCQHGFFEYALGRVASPKEAAEQICGSLNTTYSDKFIFYCYHGIGHGVLMARAYDLQGGLNVCNTLAAGQAQEGCWQGVFMENVNGGLTGQTREGIFSDTDSLAPCDTLDPKYHHECFINHAGWLMRFFHNSVKEASRACTNAPVDGIEACLQSIGLMTTNPSWQKNLASGATGSLQKIAWGLCTTFPPSNIDSCVRGDIDTIMNFDELKTDRAVAFCALVDDAYRSGCAEHIGISLKSQTTDSETARRACETLPDTMRPPCLRGAGIPM